MKKTISIIIVLTMLFSLAGCKFSDLFNDMNEPDEVNKLFGGGIFINNVSDITELDETEISDTDSLSSYSYSKLNDTQKSYYRIFLTAAEDMTEGFVLLGSCSDSSNTDIHLSYRALLFDRPEIFWLPDSYLVGEKTDGKETNITVAFDYTDGDNSVSYKVAKDKRNNMRKSLDAVIAKVTAGAGKYATDFEKEKYLNDYICNAAEYVTDSELGDTAYGCLVEGKALCEGYSAAFKLLCVTAGIDCDVICGTSKNEGHMWNCVKIDGAWCHIDVTWNDTDEGGSYAYFNLSDEQITEDHIISPCVSEVDDGYIMDGGSFNYFKRNCITDSNTYYMRTGSVISSDYKAAARLIEKCNSDDMKSVTLMFADEDARILFERDNNGFFQNIQNCLDSVVLDKFSFHRNVITIYWK